MKKSQGMLFSLSIKVFLFSVELLSVYYFCTFDFSLLCFLSHLILCASILSLSSTHPPPTFGSSPNLQGLEIHDDKAHVNHGDSDINSTSRTTRLNCLNSWVEDDKFMILVWLHSFDIECIYCSQSISSWLFFLMSQMILCRPMHEITFSTIDKPKTLTQVPHYFRNPPPFLFINTSLIFS